MTAAPVITVLGASGFLGRNLLRHLRGLPLPQGTTVRLASRTPRFPPAPPRPGDSHIAPLLETPVRCDVSSTADLRAALAGSTHVVNLVGILHETRPASTFEALQAEAPGKLASVLQAADVPPRAVVHVSAIGADAASASAYARTKAAGEAAVSALAAKHDVPVTVLRPSIVFGPDDAFFNRFASIARISPFLPLVGGGHTRFQPVHVRDVARAIAVSLGLEGEAAGSPGAAGAEASETREAAPSAPEQSTDQESEEGEAAPSAREQSAGPVVYELGGANVLTFKQLMELLLGVTKQRRLLLPLPFSAATVQGRLFEAVHSAVPSIPPLLTADQVELLRSDNVVTDGMPGLADLGITARSCDAASIGYTAMTARGKVPNPEVD